MKVSADGLDLRSFIEGESQQAAQKDRRTY